MAETGFYTLGSFQTNMLLFFCGAKKTAGGSEKFGIIYNKLLIINKNKKIE